MPYFGVPIRNGLPIGLGSQAGFGIAPFDPRDLFAAGEQGAWYDPSDFSTLFTDSAGTTPVTGVEQFVGLMLDKSKGLVLGPELVDTMNTAAAWTGYGTNTVVNEDGGVKITYVDNSAGARAFFAGSDGLTQNLIVGAQYAVTGEARVNAGSSVNIQVNAPGATVYKTVTSTTYEQFSFRFIASDPTSNLLATTGMGAGEVIWLRNFSVKQVAGNHATSTGTKRPKLAARYNLLTYTEQFDNAAWTKVDATITQNAVIAPDGTATADALFEAATTGVHYISQGPTTAAAQYKYSIYIKANGRTRIAIVANSNYGGGFSSGVFFDVGTGQYISGGTGTPSITDAGNGWWLVTYTWTAAAFGGAVLGVFLVDTGTNTSYAGDPTKGVYLWGADLRPTSQATGLIGPTYQRVVDAATYDTTGFLPYLQFDGIDDSMSTGSIDFTATDKMTVWAGVRKLSDAAVSVITELSALTGSNDGSFNLPASGAAGAGAKYGSALRGTTLIFGDTATSYAAPITNVLTQINDIAQSTAATEQILKINGTQVSLTFVGADAGAGNFGNYPLFIGARNNASLYFNGWLTSLIVRGAQSTQSQIEATESWVNGKTGAY